MPHTLAVGIRLSSLEALVPDDLEKHVHLNRATLTSSKHRVSVEVMHKLETRSRKARHPGRDDPKDIGASGKGKGKRSKGEGKRKQRHQGQSDKDKDRDKNRESIECWNCGKCSHHSKDCWSKKDQTNKDVSRR